LIGTFCVRRRQPLKATLQNYSGAPAMSTPPAVSIAPPPRCYDRGENRCGPPCGEITTHFRPGRDWFSNEYFCSTHRGPGDVLIAADHVFRRVTVFCDVYFAGVSSSAPMSQTEAVSRLEAIVRAAGGALDVHQVRSYVVRSSPQPGPRTEFAGQGGRE